MRLLNKSILITITLMAASSNAATDNTATNMRTFENFSAPAVSGAYKALWFPVGPTDKGLIYGIGFYLVNGSETTPTVMWLGKGDAIPMEVKSLAAINDVVHQLTPSNPSETGRLGAIEVICRLIARPLAAKGATGFSLDRQLNRAVTDIIARLKGEGLDNDTVLMLERFEQEARTEIDGQNNRWMRSWYEIDPIGAVERVVVHGVLAPMKTTSVLREAVFEKGKVRVDLLVREKMSEAEPKG